jgi:cyanophycinase
MDRHPLLRHDLQWRITDLSTALTTRTLMTHTHRSARAPAGILLSLALFVGILLPACSASTADSQAEEVSDDSGALVIIGGGLSAENEAVYQAILDLRQGEGPLCVIPTAGASPESSMESAVSRIDRWGGDGTARGLLLHLESPDEADETETAVAIQGCSGFYFTGGVQSRILDFFLPEGRGTVAHTALLERFREGAVIAGSSAGAAMMSDPMIAGGSSEAAFESGTALTAEDEGVRIRPGMGFVSGAVMDQHFLARGRIGRLLIAVSRLPEVEWGAGIDENTALVVQEHRARVVGASGVIMVNGRGMTTDHDAPDAMGLVVELMGSGDEIDLRTFEVTPAEGRSALDQDQEHPEGPHGAELFERWAFLHLLHALGGSEMEAWSTEVLGTRVDLRRGEGFRAVSTDSEGVEGTPYGLSVGPLLVDLVSR